MSLVKGGVTHFWVWKTCSQTECEVLFQPVISVQVSFFFSSSSASSNALAICWRLLSGQQTSVCRQTPSACPHSPLFPPTLSPIGQQTGLCESHQLPSTRTGLEPLLPQPPFLPKTPSAHIHLTLPLSVLTTYPPKNLFPSLSGYTLTCRTGLPHILYRWLIGYSRQKKFADSSLLYLSLVKVALWKSTLLQLKVLCS